MQQVGTTHEYADHLGGSRRCVVCSVLAGGRAVGAGSPDRPIPSSEGDRPSQQIVAAPGVGLCHLATLDLGGARCLSQVLAGGQALRPSDC